MTPIVYIKMPTHICQWAYHAYGCPVVFPAIGYEVAVIRRFMSKPPEASLLPVEEESLHAMRHYEASRLHCSMAAVAADAEWTERRWQVYPDDYLAIRLPESKAKPAEEYCYLGPRARKAVGEVVADLFKIDLWSSLKDLADRTCRLSSLIGAWCEQRGIGIDYEDTVRQCFYRMREQHAKRGVNLISPTRINKN